MYKLKNKTFYNFRHKIVEYNGKTEHTRDLIRRGKGQGRERYRYI